MPIIFIMKTMRSIQWNYTTFYMKISQPVLSLSIIVFSSLLLLFSCKRENVTEGCYDLSSNIETSIFDIFDEVDAIQLETCDESLLAGIGKAQLFGSKLFILGSRRILCFSDEGRFLFQVSRQGKGVGEYHHVSDIAIDKHNKRLILLDAVVQRVHFFDLDGTFQQTIRIESETSLGLNRVFPLEDSLLLFVGLYEKDFILYCMKRKTILERLGGLQDCPSFFMPSHNAYMFENSVFVLPPFENTVYKVSGQGFFPHDEWCFGENNNTPEQIERLKSNFHKWLVVRRSLPPNAIVGKGKYLNHYLRNVRENDRFIIAQLEFNNDFKNIVIDKKTGNRRLFNQFQEGIQLFLQGIINDNILFYSGGNYGGMDQIYRQIIETKDEQDKPYYEDYYFKRNRTYYTRDILTERGKQVYDKHDPMYDNPYLVVFKFKQ